MIAFLKKPIMVGLKDMKPKLWIGQWAYNFDNVESTRFSGARVKFKEPRGSQSPSGGEREKAKESERERERRSHGEERETRRRRFQRKKERESLNIADRRTAESSKEG